MGENHPIREKIKSICRYPFIRALLFFLFLMVFVLPMMTLFTSNRLDISERENGFKKEPKNTLDAVYIGSSNAYTYFQPPLAWNDFGIAVYNYAVSSLRMWGIKYRIAEARKTQPNALYIVNINSFKEKGFGAADYAIIHWNIDYMPFSINRFCYTYDMVKGMGIDFFDSWEYFLPMIRFHSRWSSLKSTDYIHPISAYKGAGAEINYINNISDNSNKPLKNHRTGNISDHQKKVLDDLMQYIDREKIKVLFVRIPTMNEENEWESLNTIENILIERGYDCIDLYDVFSELGLQKDTDYADPGHTNIHGSIKITKYLSSYLIDHYGFQNKRGSVGWESWDDAAEKYIDLIKISALDFEINHSPRDYNLKLSNAFDVKQEGTNQITILWEAIKNADGYLIYRKSKASGYQWIKIAEITNINKTSFTDTDLNESEEYTYLVVPFYVQFGERIYGKYDPLGINITL